MSSSVSSSPRRPPPSLPATDDLPLLPSTISTTSTMNYLTTESQAYKDGGQAVSFGSSALSSSSRVKTRRELFCPYPLCSPRMIAARKEQQIKENEDVLQQSLALPGESTQTRDKDKDEGQAVSFGSSALSSSSRVKTRRELFRPHPLCSPRMIAARKEQQIKENEDVLQQSLALPGQSTQTRDKDKDEGQAVSFGSSALSSSSRVKTRRALFRPHPLCSPRMIAARK